MVWKEEGRILCARNQHTETQTPVAVANPAGYPLPPAPPPRFAFALTPGADGDGREQTRHGYPFGRHHIEPRTIIDTAREKRHGLLERLNRKFEITFSFMCITTIVALSANCRSTIVAKHCMCNATIVVQLCMCIVETPLQVIAQNKENRGRQHLFTFWLPTRTRDRTSCLYVHHNKCRATIRLACMCIAKNVARHCMCIAATNGPIDFYGKEGQKYYENATR
jgi:hypothetical protein